MPSTSEVVVKFRADMTELNEALEDTLMKAGALAVALDRIATIRGKTSVTVEEERNATANRDRAA